ncbi:hypothetical protein HAX54_014037 [Datura stramonium]|uniref:Uncharacterized protein n=1 Tax=Datura stramonium TaxID=4076 RepID=A0ABS8TNY8_DATST|nr:hypothetical protein [Datura stramonium]
MKMIFSWRAWRKGLPKSVEELYLRHFCGHTTPAWIAPESLDLLQYLCIDDSSVLQHMSYPFRGSDGNKWKVEGLCLKYLPKLEETWEEIKSAMPGLKPIASACGLEKELAILDSVWARDVLRESD